MINNSKNCIGDEMKSCDDFIKEAQNHKKRKVCRGTCNKHKLLSEFFKNNNTKDGLQYHCKSCNKEYKDTICRFKRWFQSKKARANSPGIEFSIEPTDIPGVKIRETFTIDRRGRKYTSWEATQYPKVCPVLGMKLDWSMNGLTNNSPSLDRVNNKLGYIKGNVMLMSNLANKMKSNATPKQVNQFSRYYLFGNQE
jgi:hypothetical protein